MTLAGDEKHIRDEAYKSGFDDAVRNSKNWLETQKKTLQDEFKKELEDIFEGSRKFWAQKSKHKSIQTTPLANLLPILTVNSTMQTNLQTFPTTESSIQMTPLAVYRTASTQTISQTSRKSHTDPQNTPYSGFQNCPNVCMFYKDLGIVAQ